MAVNGRIEQSQQIVITRIWRLAPDVHVVLQTVVFVVVNSVNVGDFANELHIRSVQSHAHNTLRNRTMLYKADTPMLSKRHHSAHSSKWHDKAQVLHLLRRITAYFIEHVGIRFLESFVPPVQSIGADLGIFQRGSSQEQCRRLHRARGRGTCLPLLAMVWHGRHRE